MNSSSEVAGAGVEGSEQAQGSAGRLTERDRQLFSMLAEVKYLSTDQVGRLIFPGRKRTVVTRRLAALAGEGGSRARCSPPCLRRFAYRTLEGAPRTAWTLSSHGYGYVRRMVGEEVKKPKSDVGPEFLAHEVQLNELYVRLLEQPLAVKLAQVASTKPGSLAARRRLLDGVYARAEHPSFRWEASDGARLPWTEYDLQAGKTRERVILPDAVLDLVVDRRRLFLECEMGTNSIVASSDEKGGATLAKLERYEGYLNGVADGPGQATFYQRAFPDGFAPEVLFLVLTESRARSVSAAVNRWRNGRGGQPFRIQAMTLQAAVTALLPRAWTGAPVPPSPTEVLGSSLTGPDLELIRGFCRSTVDRFKELRAAARSRNTAPPPYPAGTSEVLELLRRLGVPGGAQ